MPVIPFATSERSIPGSSGRINAPTEDPVGAALTRAGTQIEQTSGRFMNVLTAQRHYEEANRINHETEKAGNDLRENVQLIIQAQKENLNYTSDTTRESFDSVRNNIKAKIKYPRVLQVFDDFADKQFIALMSDAHVLDMARLVDARRAEAIRTRTFNIQDAVNAPTLDKLKAIIKRNEEEENARVKLGVYDESDAQVFKDAFKSKVAETYYEELISVNPAQAIEDLKNKNNEITKYLDPAKIRALKEKAQKAGNDQIVTGASAFVQDKFTKSDGSIDVPAAISYALNEKNLKEYKNLSINDRQNIVQSLTAIGSAQNVQKNLRQDANIDKVYRIAMTNVPEAILAAKRLAVDDADAEKIKQFVWAAESHIMNQKVMSLQETTMRTQLEDSAKTNIELNIRNGKYKNESEVQQAVLSAGFTKTADIMKESINTYRNEEKYRGQVNYFNESIQDWKRYTSAGSSKAARTKRGNQEIEIQKTLSSFMKDNNFAPTDEKIFQKYEEIKKHLTSSFLGDVLWNDPKEYWFGGETKNSVSIVSPSAPRSIINDGAIRRDLNSGRREIWKGGSWQPL